MSFTGSVDVTGSVEAGVDVSAVASLAGIADENAKIIPIWPPGIPVVFSYNPENIKVKRKSSTNTPTDTTGSFGQQWVGSSPTEINFFAYLEGPQTRPMAEQLLALSVPSKGIGGIIGMLAGLAGIPLPEQLPVVMFMWGTWVVPTCNLEMASIDYERFHSTGLPLRAKCTIKLKEVPTKLGFTNPTSGGLPGREQHVVVAGESLPQLAMRSYGRPGNWRDVARANNIDDPFAVKPGDNLFMPSPGELNRGGRA